MRKTMKVQLVTGHMVEIQDVGMSYCAFFAFAGNGRIIGVGRDSEGRNAIFFWREVAGLWEYHSHITMRNSIDGDTFLTIAATTSVRPKMSRPDACSDMDLIIIG